MPVEDVLQVLTKSVVIGKTMEKNDTTFIILGATGDLAKRKLLPAIYNLVRNKHIRRFAIVGAAYDDTTAEKILSESKRFIKDFDSGIWKRIINATSYVKFDFSDEKGYALLHKIINSAEKKYRLACNRIFYLATLPENFGVITKNLAAAELVKESYRREGWSRVVYEKPFGTDLKSARKINQCICKLFSEKHVYRIDHYLGKELVGTIALSRFTNRVLEPLWSNNHIESVEIIMKENIGIENRGHFYDKYGTIKDVVQNHMLQLLALTAMEAPKSLTGEDIRDEKVKVLKKTVVEDFLLGQYAGYTAEAGVKKSSVTETFAALKLKINNARWRGVPFYIKAGKALNEKNTMIRLNFKPVECLLTKSCPSETNHLDIKIQPKSGFDMHLNAKVPRANDVVPVKMNFCYDCLFGANTPEAYENLLLDVIKGDQSVFVRGDEIELSWKVISPIITNKNRKKVHKYKRGSEGPSEIKGWCKKHKMRWHE